MRIVFVGAGRLATNFARALQSAGHEITAVYSRTMAAAETLSRLVGGIPTDSVGRLPAEADAYIIAVKDSVLADVIAQLSKGRAGQTFFHTAGSVSLAVFGQHQQCGVIYPMQTFSKEREVDFSRVPIFVEAATWPVLQVARLMASSVSGTVRELSSDDRRYLHLAAVFACNFTNHCYALAARLLEQRGLSFDVLLPLIAETADKVEDVHPLQAQTGPAVRYDENVISSQHRLLDGHPQLQAVYDLLSHSIHQTATEQT